MHQVLVRMWSNRKAHALLVETQNEDKITQSLPYDLAITLLDIYPNKLKTYIHTKVVVIV